MNAAMEVIKLRQLRKPRQITKLLKAGTVSRHERIKILLQQNLLKRQ